MFSQTFSQAKLDSDQQLRSNILSQRIVIQAAFNHKCYKYQVQGTAVM